MFSCHIFSPCGFSLLQVTFMIKKKKKTLQKRAEGITYEYRIQSLADLGLNPGSSAH